MYKIGLRFTECLLHIELSIYAITPNEISLMGSLILNFDADSPFSFLYDENLSSLSRLD